MSKNERTTKGSKPETWGLSIAGIGGGDAIVRVLPIGGRNELNSIASTEALH